MSFERDEQLAMAVEDFYGEYVTTFWSQTRQVRADIFRVSGGHLIAHVSFAPGYTSYTVTDPYLSELKRYADTLHAPLSLRIAA